MIPCRQAAELIPLHVGDDLPTEDARHLEEHLEQCALCVAEYDSFAAARGAILDLREELPARGSLWAEVSRGLDATAPTAPLRRRSLRAQWAAWGGLAAAAALALIVLPPFLRPDPAAEPSNAHDTVAGPAPLKQAATPEELQDFLLRSSAWSNLTPGQPAQPAAADAPLTTPAGVRRYQ